ncbi:MAG: DUF1854 domain-containing protein [Thermofilaceae archaeon]
MLHKELKVLDPKNMRVIAAYLDEVNIEINGQLIQGVRPRKPFPYSHPEIVIFYKGNEEIGILRDYRMLDDESKSTLEKALKVVYFMPEIKKVLNIRWAQGRYEWCVVTDKGEEKFETWSRCVRVLLDGRLVVKDIYSRAYIVEHPEKLDAKSKALLTMMI